MFLYISIAVRGLSFRKQNLKSAVKGHNCKHRVITLFQSFQLERKSGLSKGSDSINCTATIPLEWALCSMYHPDQIAVWKTVHFGD